MMRWQSRDPWQSLSLMTSPTWDTCAAFRFRNDDGSETSATWKASQNQNVVQPVLENFRIRLLNQMTNSGDATNTTAALQFRVNGGSWQAVGAALSTTLAVRVVASSNVDHETATTSQLTGGTGSFVPGFLLTLSSGAPEVSYTSGSHSEYEWCIELTDLAEDEDVIEFRVVLAGTAHPATHIPQVIASTAVRPNAPTLLSPTGGIHSADGSPPEPFEWTYNAGDAGLQTKIAFRRDVLFEWSTSSNLWTDGRRANGIDFSVDGSFLAIAVINTATNERLFVYEKDGWSQITVPGLAGSGEKCHFSPDVSLLAVAVGASQAIQVLTTSNWSLDSGWPTSHPDWGHGVRFSPDGAWLLLSYRTGGQITVINTETKQVETTFTIDGGQGVFDFSPTDNYLAVAHGSGKRLTIFDTSNPDPSGWSIIPDTPTLPWTGLSVAFSKDGKWLVATHSDHVKPVTVVDTSDWTVAASLLEQEEGLATACVFSNDSSRLFIGGQQSNTLHIFDSSDLNPENWSIIPNTFLPNNWVRVVGIDPDDEYLTVGTNAGESVWIVEPESWLPTWWNGEEFVEEETSIPYTDESITFPTGSWS